MGFFLKLLGLVDILGALLLFLDPLDIIPIRWVLIVAACLVMKGIAFKGGPVSTFDIILGLYVAATIFTNWGLLNTVFGLYLCIKGLYSFF